MSEAKVRHSSRGRTIAVWALIVAASLLAIGSATSTWAKRQALDTDNWVKASDEVLAKPAVQHALAVYIVDQLYTNVDVAATFEQRLPDDLKQLGAPLAAAVRSPAQDGVERLLASPKMQALWSQVNRQAHAALVRILEDKTRVGSTANGVVTLDLGTLVRQLGQQLGLPAAALDKIPADAGKITLIQSDRLKTAQDAVKVIKVGTVFLLILVVAMYALAAYLAVDRRRTIRNSGWALVFSALVLLAIRRYVMNYVVGLVNAAEFRDAASATLLIWTSLLRQLALAGVAYGLAVVGWAFVAGPTRAGTAIRRTLAPALNMSAGLVAAWAGGIFLLLLVWAPTPAFRFGQGLLVLAVLYALGIVALRRETMVQFADVTFADIGAGVVATYHRFVGGKPAEVAPVAAGPTLDAPVAAATATPPAAPAGTTVDLTAIERLHQLHVQGALSDAEFSSAKEELLGPAKTPH